MMHTPHWRRGPRTQAPGTTVGLVLGLVLASLVAVTEAAAPPSYVSGGIGESGRAELTAIQDQYSLKLVFAARSGAFLSAVAVEISDADGQALLSAVSDGPWMLVDLPAGRYRISATFREETQTQEVEVPASGLRQVDLRW